MFGPAQTTFKATLEVNRRNVRSKDCKRRNLGWEIPFPPTMTRHHIDRKTKEKPWEAAIEKLIVSMLYAASGRTFEETNTFSIFDWALVDCTKFSIREAMAFSEERWWGSQSLPKSKNLSDRHSWAAM